MAGRPLIGIAGTASDLNRCDRGLTARGTGGGRAAAVRRGVQAAGGLPLEFGVMSLSEDLMKPTAMLYRNLLAIEVEETIRSQPRSSVRPASFLTLAGFGNAVTVLAAVGGSIIHLYAVAGRRGSFATDEAVRGGQRAGVGDGRCGADRDRAG